MKLSDFDYKLPRELIAQKPISPRNHSRLLVYDRRTGKIIDDHFFNLSKHLPTATTLVLNNSKVEKCRLRFSNIEVFVIEVVNPTTVKALVRPGKKFQVGKPHAVKLGKGHSLAIETVDVDPQGIRTLSLSLPIDDNSLSPYRLTPLPPYIRQDESLADKYQTVYAKPPGSKAAPTAGLHFTRSQLAAMEKERAVVELTLHVGLGTFAPVKTENINEHKLHHEWYELTAEAAQALNEAKHITAVGTTSTRTLESLDRPFRASSGETDIFIKPGHEFKNVDALITNFHLPKSTLLMLVAAFVGSTEEAMKIYRYAVEEKYRFYSFGDAMLIL